MKLSKIQEAFERHFVTDHPILKAFHIDYIYDRINQPGNEYPYGLIGRWKQQQPEARSPRHKIWDLDIYLFELNRGTTGAKASPMERLDLWDTLDELSEQVVTGINQMDESGLNPFVVSDYTKEFDSQTMGVDDLVWVKITLRLYTDYDCPASLP